MDTAVEADVDGVSVILLWNFCREEVEGGREIDALKLALFFTMALRTQLGHVRRGLREHEVSCQI